MIHPILARPFQVFMICLLSLCTLSALSDRAYAESTAPAEAELQNCLAHKGILFTRIQHPKLGPIDVYNTHFQSRPHADARALRIAVLDSKVLYQDKYEDYYLSDHFAVQSRVRFSQQKLAYE